MAAVGFAIILVAEDGEGEHFSEVMNAAISKQLTASQNDTGLSSHSAHSLQKLIWK